MSTLHLILGPVGAGKSTYAAALAARLPAPRFTLDMWMATLYGDDPRPPGDRRAWYAERVDRCLSVIESITFELAERGTPVVLELGLIRRAARLAFYDRVADHGHPLRVHLLDAPREVRRARVVQRNEARGPTFSMEVPLEVFELASDLWEPPDAQERARVEVTDVPHGPIGTLQTRSARS